MEKLLWDISLEHSLGGSWNSRELLFVTGRLFIVYSFPQDVSSGVWGPRSPLPRSIPAKPQDLVNAAE